MTLTFALDMILEWVDETDMMSMMIEYARVFHGPFPDASIQYYTAELVSALEHLRQRGFVHR